jgi:hypothetical protein
MPNDNCMKKTRALKCIAVLLGSLAMLATAVDAKPGKGKDKDKDNASHSKKENKNPQANHKDKDKGEKAFKHGQAARFNDAERDDIVGYFGRYRNQGEGLPPGLAMNQRRGKPLPPGWQKKLAPGYRIDDISWLSFAPVPLEWFPKLRMEPDTRLYHYGDRVVRVYEPRREVIEVIVLPGY